MPRSTKKIAVIGAGPAGMTAAYELAKRGFKVDVYEASNAVGGLARTIELWGQKVDLGPHRFFSSDTRVNQLWLEVAGKDYEMVDRLTRIFYKNKFFYYPLKPFNALINLGFLESFLCLFSYMKETLRPTKLDGTFENWVISRFGKKLYGIFFKTYSEKLWGISCRELDSEFAAQRIKKLSLYEAIKNALFAGSKNKHKTLVDQFAFPISGSGMIYEKMAKFVKKQDGRLLLKTPVESIINSGSKVMGLKLASGKTVKYDHVVSSMPLTQMVSRLKNVPNDVQKHVAELKYRNTILVYLQIEATNLFPDNWLYVHSTEIATGRITNFRNWVPNLYGDKKTSILVLEYWCDETDSLWKKSDKNLIDQASDEIRKTGLIKNVVISAGHVHRISKSYPVYKTGYRKHLAPVEKYLSAFTNLGVIGRYGAFKYNNQDHSILMGILAAENIAEGKRNNLWEINSDDEYQESSKITKTGLVKV